LLWRIIPHLSLFGEVGFIVPDIEYSTYTMPSGPLTTSSTSAFFLDILVGLRYHILGSGFWDPWLDAGVGWSRWTDAPDPGGSGDNYYNAAVVKIGGGLDLFLTQFIALGVRLDATVPIWLDTTGPSCDSGDLCYNDRSLTTGPDVTDLDSSELPIWWSVGLNMTLYFMAI
jgi:hypothetical protein